MHFGRLTTVGLSLFALTALASVTAHAQVTISLDNPFQSVPIPGSGSITVNFTGTVSIAPGYTWSGTELDYAFNVDSSHVITTTFGPVNLSDADNGGSVSGLLFTADVPSTTLADYFGYHASTLDPALYQVTATPVAGGDFTAAASFSVTTTAGPADTPEPGSVALFVGLGVSSGIFLKRRKRAAL